MCHNLETPSKTKEFLESPPFFWMLMVQTNLMDFFQEKKIFLPDFLKSLRVRNFSHSSPASAVKTDEIGLSLMFLSV